MGAPERSRKPNAGKSTTKNRVENVRFYVVKNIFVEKYGIQSTNEITIKRTVTSRQFSISAIKFDAPRVLSFSESTHAHAKCPRVYICIRVSGPLCEESLISNAR